MRNRLAVLTSLLFVLSLGLLCPIRQAEALSPFQTVSGIGGPLPGTILNCKTVLVSSFTATQVLAANSQREALYVTNISSVPTVVGNRLPLVFISSFAVTNLANADWGTTTLTGFGMPLWATQYSVIQSSVIVQGERMWSMSGGSIYQGPVYAITTDGINSKVNACEMIP